MTNIVIIEGEFELVFCGGGAKPTDTHLDSIIHCANDEIIEWLARREAKQCYGNEPGPRLKRNN
jgi:hypothetical protein